MADADSSPKFAPELAALLQPIAPDQPAGPSLRYDPAFAQIREARDEDDPTLPMGEWTRPLKKADWRAVASRSEAVLRTRSKDIQVAFWLAEGWLRLHGIPGLSAGAQLLEALLTRFWDEIHPVSDGDDHDARVAPFVWANDTLTQTLLLHVPLMSFPDLTPPYVTLNDWQRAVSGEFGLGTHRTGAQPKNAEPVVSTPLVATRQEILDEAARDLYALVDLDEQVALAAAAWDRVAELMDQRLGADSPSLSKVADTLLQLHLAARSLLQDRDPRDRVEPEPEAPTDTDPLPEPEPTEFDTDAFEVHAMTDAVPAFAPNAPPPEGPSNAASVRIGSRADAYLLLEMAAAYLKRTEPHSPTPYLVTRAVTWGRMPLPELMQEVLREEGDLNRYFSMLGVRPE